MLWIGWLSCTLSICSRFIPSIHLSPYYLSSHYNATRDHRGGLYGLYYTVQIVMSEHLLLPQSSPAIMTLPVSLLPITFLPIEWIQTSPVTPDKRSRDPWQPVTWPLSGAIVWPSSHLDPVNDQLKDPAALILVLSECDTTALWAVIRGGRQD